MNMLLIAKQIFAYSNWMNKARKKVQNNLLNQNCLDGLDFEQRIYFKNVFYNKKLDFKSLNDEQKLKLNQFIDAQLNWLENEISQITDDMNQKTWILKNYVNGTYIPEQDDEKFEETLQLFNHYKKRKQMVKKDIKQYSSFSQLFSVVSKFLTMQNVFQFANSQCKKICSKGSFSCYKVDDFQQAKILFSQTGWCVKGKGYFQSYGPPYYLVFKGQNRFALVHLDSEQCKDTSDAPIDLSSCDSDFIKLLGVLFEAQNNGQFIVDNDFYNAQAVYIKNCMDQIDNLIPFIVQAIDNETFYDIKEIFESAESVGKLNNLIDNLQITDQLQLALKVGQTDDNYFCDFVIFLINHDVKLCYPESAMYIVAQEDDVDLWITFWSCNQTFESYQYYEETVLSTNFILKYELERNNFQLTRFNVQETQYLLNDFVDMIDSLDGAKQFLKMFWWDNTQQLSELIEELFDHLDLNEQQKEYLEQYLSKQKKKEAFDNYPTLPGLEK